MVSLVHVVHIALTDIYDNSTTTSDALAKMETTHGGDLWHYAGIDLHHALLANTNLAGGLASLGAICDPEQGFGVSGSIKGDFVSLDAATLWDVYVFAHEIG